MQWLVLVRIRRQPSGTDIQSYPYRVRYGPYFQIR